MVTIGVQLFFFWPMIVFLTDEARVIRTHDGPKNP